MSEQEAAFLPWMNPGVPGGLPLWTKRSGLVATVCLIPDLGAGGSLAKGPDLGIAELSHTRQLIVDGGDANYPR